MELQHWSQVATLSKTVPDSRYGHALALLNQSSLLLFGGYHNKKEPTFFDDTWVATLSSGKGNSLVASWSMIPTTRAPQARYSHTLSQSGEVSWLFGGDDGGRSFLDPTAGYVKGHYFNDLWSFKSSRMPPWKEHEKGEGENLNWPKPRSAHSACFIHNEMIIFGGLVRGKSLGVGWQVADTDELWTMTGHDESYWRLENFPTSKKPRPRHGHAAVCAKSQMFLFGGANNNIGCKPSSRPSWSCSRSLADMWKWDAGTRKWTEIIEKAASKTHMALSYSSLHLTSSGILVFGGANCNPACRVKSESWLLGQDSTWNHVSCKSHPVARYRHAFASNVLGHAIIFGGEAYGSNPKYRSDMWSLKWKVSLTDSRLTAGHKFRRLWRLSSQPLIVLFLLVLLYFFLAKNVKIKKRD